MKHVAKRLTASVVAGSLLVAAAAIGSSLPAQADSTPPSGLYDTTFVNDVSFPDQALAIQSDGKVLIFEQDAANKELGRLSRFNSDGSRDLSFGAGNASLAGMPGHAAEVNTLDVGPDGKIYVSGSFISYTDAETHMINKIVRLHPDGTFDDSFRSIFSDDYFSDLAPDRLRFTVDNKIIAIATGQPGMHLGQKNGVARLNYDGSFDPTFNPDNPAATGMYGTADVWDVMPNNDLILESSVYYDGAGEHRAVGGVRVSPDGIYLAPAFPRIQSIDSPGNNSGTFYQARRLADGKFLVSGSFDH